MKKFILVLLAVVSFSATYGQTRWHEKQNAHFVEQAKAEYSLTDEQADELSEKRLEMVKSFIGSNSDFKAGNITQEEKKEVNRGASRTFNGYFSQLVGKPYAEIAPFLKRMREEIKNL